MGKSLESIKLPIIPELLSTDHCATVKVNHTNHPSYPNSPGLYFYFDENEFTKMVGEKGWNNKKFEVIQRGSKNWTGTVIVWDSIAGRPYGGASGRIEPRNNAAHWVQGDRIQLKACGEAGI